jgi:hypothetical protein
MLVGNSLQIKVATLSAVGSDRKLQRNRLGKKAALAFRASPRAQPREADGVIPDTLAPGTATSFTQTSGTDHAGFNLVTLVFYEHTNIRKGWVLRKRVEYLIDGRRGTYLRASTGSTDSSGN